MAFIRLASAIVTNPDVQVEGWGRIKRASSTTSATKLEASLMKLSEFRPEDYLFTHATIVASVDTESEKDWLIKPETSDLVNDNGDCWSRGVLQASYHTFRGAENYLEHVQIPEHSKGKILDAAIRDLGTHDYVDILVATARKHKDVIDRIVSGELDSMSMGAQVEFTICSRCGNRAFDEVQLCPCIKYQKGQRYVDPEDGIERIIAELCGHVDSPGSNKFIEASWVAQPAFRGAKSRGILEVNKPLVVAVQNGHDLGNKKATFETEEQAKEREEKKRTKKAPSLADENNNNLIKADSSNNTLIAQVLRLAETEGWKKVASVYQVPVVFQALVEADRKRGDVRLSRRAYALIANNWQSVRSNGISQVEEILGRPLQAMERSRVQEILNLM